MKTKKKPVADPRNRVRLGSKKKLPPEKKRSHGELPDGFVITPNPDRPRPKKARARAQAEAIIGSLGLQGRVVFPRIVVSVSGAEEGVEGSSHGDELFHIRCDSHAQLVENLEGLARVMRGSKGPLRGFSEIFVLRRRSS